MNANQIISMIGRMVMRRLISRGVNAGIDTAFGKGKAPKDMTPEERQQARSAKKTSRQAKRAMRVARRAGRL
ncbi:hypothetical protein ROJ8625_01247 [Roseivivax jejudonensis]|uniref:Uncharacterized protein n=1 Tax=Roseivivax jejudonensis TaxID=1529041 RepID=A0A1X6YRK8_9RHOB|nr:hypothetical protein [Roseivivax jejudonensis]SLN29193.1 hypothetical protein ROJ8625_01247 [Roseivivax jejudonensis]